MKQHAVTGGIGDQDDKMGALGACIRALRPESARSHGTMHTQQQLQTRYANLSTALSHHFVQSEQCTPTALATMVSELRTFLDTHLGKGSDPRRRPQLTIFPARLFEDASQFGALSTILHAVFQFAEEHAIRPVRFCDPKNVATYFRILLHVEKLLKKHHFLKPIKVFLSPLIPDDDAAKLRNILQTHDAAIVSTADVATHVVYPDPPGTSEQHTDDQLLIRLLEKAQVDAVTTVRVHWLHHPDSYDDWLPETHVLGHLHLPYSTREQHNWHVQARWVRDLDIYNEWMNELDYEMPPFYNAFLDPKPLYASCYLVANSLSRVRLRLRMTDSERKHKRRRGDSNSFRMIGLPSLSLDEPANGQSPSHPHASQNGSLPNDDNISISSSEDSSVLDSDTGTLARKSSSEPPEPSPANDKDETVQQETVTAKDSNSKIPIGNDAFMPSYSSWFRLNAVHDLERRALPEFFCGKFPSKTEMSYREVRNFMILTWRKNPKQYISGTAARRHFSGDACSVLRVHDFLEHWGLINYCSLGDSAPPPLFAPPPRPLPVFAGSENDDACRKGMPLMLDDGSRAELRQFSVAKFGRRGEELKAASADGTVLIRETDQNAGSGQIADRPQREPIEYHCDSCGIDCSELRFHCATKADMDLCASCYHNSKYADSVKPRDFIQMNSAGVNSNFEDIDVDLWTESETLLLLEALEMFGDNWALVSEHVGSKGKAQCVAQFLRLPIEDPFLTNTTKRWWSVEADKKDSTSTPTEMLRKAGARETALASIASKGSSSRVFSGRPLICADQMNTVVPFAGLLSSLAPGAILEDLIKAVGIPLRRRIRGAFREVLQSGALRGVKRGHAANDSDEENVPKRMAVEKHMISDGVYKQLSGRMTEVSKVLSRKCGPNVTRASLALLHDGAIPPQELDDLRIDDRWHLFRNEMESSKERPAVRNDTTTVESDVKDVQEKEKESKVEVDSASSTAVALTALTAACVNAAQWRDIESAEIDRLVRLAQELRLAMIRLKVQHLAEINRHVLLSRDLRRRTEQKQVCDRIKRCVNFLRIAEDQMGDADFADYLNDTPVFKSGNQNDSGNLEQDNGVACLQIMPVNDGIDADMQQAFLSWTDTDGYKSEVNQDSVPVLSGVATEAEGTEDANIGLADADETQDKLDVEDAENIEQTYAEGAGDSSAEAGSEMEEDEMQDEEHEVDGRNEETDMLAEMDGNEEEVDKEEIKAAESGDGEGLGDEEHLDDCNTHFDADGNFMSKHEKERDGSDNGTMQDDVEEDIKTEAAEQDALAAAGFESGGE